jgi:hypothetical protein
VSVFQAPIPYPTARSGTLSEIFVSSLSSICGSLLQPFTSTSFSNIINESLGKGELCKPGRRIPRSPATEKTPTPLTTEPPKSIEETIRCRAYELYEARGREDGRDLEDWLRAEAEIRGKAARVAA